MADFCKQCSEKLFKEDHRDLAGLVTEEQYRKGFVATVLCEGCGETLVDHEGRCVHDCDLHHATEESHENP